MNRSIVAGSMAIIALVAPYAPACEVETIIPELAVEGEENGRAVALHDDVMAIGAPQAGIGNVTIFRNERGVWVEAQVVSASDGFGGDRFGEAVALLDDLLFVGAPAQDPSGTPQAGAVYVCEYDGRSWNETQIIAAADPGNNDHFGSAISFDGSSLLVGSPNDFDASVGALAGSAWPATGRQYWKPMPRFSSCFSNVPRNSECVCWTARKRFMPRRPSA